MSLEGVNPVIVIQKYKDKYVFKDDEEKNKKKEFINKFVFWNSLDIQKSKFDIPDGLPVPFVLGQISNIIVTRQEIKKSNSVEFNDDLKIQSQFSNSLTIELKAKGNSIFTSAIIGLLQWCWENTSLYQYEISYFNDNFFILKGHLGDFTCVKTNESNEYNISITIDNGVTPKDKIKEEKEKKDKDGYFNSSIYKIEDL